MKQPSALKLDDGLATEDRLVCSTSYDIEGGGRAGYVYLEACATDTSGSIEEVMIALTPKSALRLARWLIAAAVWATHDRIAQLKARRVGEA